jgi:hypothetical protein
MIFFIPATIVFVGSAPSDPFGAYRDSTSSIQPQCTCPCNPLRDSYCKYMKAECYQPVCPVGTYLCCATCLFSTCSRIDNLSESTRGFRECISCPPGHFCPGCDIPVKCPETSVNPNAGMSSADACTPCQSGFIPTQDHTQCCFNGNLCSDPSLTANYLANWTYFDSGLPGISIIHILWLSILAFSMV